MTTPTQPLVDDELYVNDATLEALRNVIEHEVRGSLRRSVLLPLLVAGLALLVIAATWLIPREITNLMREDPVVERRIIDAAEQATEQYIADPAGGRTAVREQVSTALQADREMQKAINAAASAVVAQLDVEAVVQAQVGAQLEARLSEERGRFMNTEEGRGFIDQAVREYFSTAAGKKSLDAVAAEALRSPDFRSELSKDLDKILSH